MAAVAEIAESEGLRLVAYRCPAGVWTIGWGETDGVRPGDRCTKDEADRWLCEDLTERVRAVRDLCKVEPAPNELGAMVSLAYNIGLGGFAKSTVLRAHNAGDRVSASRAFGLWNKARDPKTGVIDPEGLPGLTARRAREAALYLQPEVGQPVEPMPQAIEAESKATASPINKSGVAAVGAGVVGLLSEASSGLLAPFSAVRTLLVDTLGVPTNLILPSMLVIVGVAVVYWRGKQRSKGWV
jgi:lysozyme